MNTNPSASTTAPAASAPATAAPVASPPAAISVAPIDYHAVIERSGLIPTPELVAAVAQRHREMLTPKIILQAFVRLQKEVEARRLAQYEEGKKA